MSRLAKASLGTKRLILGRPFRSDTMGHTLLPKRIALPVFASDAMSSVAYAPEEIFLVLSTAGLASVGFTPWIGLAVAVVMAVVVASYRQNVHAYPSGGGDYEVATVNLGPASGLTVGAALLVDYVLTVAVSISSAAANIGSAVPLINDHKVVFAVVAIVLLTAVNLRGVKESGAAFAVPTYAFMACIAVMILWGLVRIDLLGDTVRAPSADFGLEPSHGAVMGVAMAFLVAKAFSSGCAALTGVEAISNGVPAFRAPKSANAAATLFLLGAISITFLLGLILLAVQTGVKIAEDPSTQLVGAPADYHQKTLVAQLAEPVFSGFPVGFYLVMTFTAIILVLAANTAFNGFPVLGSVLAGDKYLPRQLATRGDRLAYSNGIVTLAVAAILLVVAFHAEVTHLIQLYIVGVFVSFTLSQLGMIRHWNRHLRVDNDARARGRMRRARVVNAIGLVFTGSVLVVVMVTKFFAGAWIAVLAMTAVFVLMKAIRKHYDNVSDELEKAAWDTVLPSRTHCVVLVSKLHLPTARALAYARATRPDSIEAITVNIDTAETRVLAREWERRGISVPLKVLESPYREITRPVVDYIKRVRADAPRDVVCVYVPEYVVGHWWEQLLHNQSALRIKARLLYEPGVMVVSVPWQLDSSEARAHRAEADLGDVDGPVALRWGAGE